MRLIPGILALGCVCATASGAAAQSKFSGKCSQGKPDPSYMIAINDNPGHAMVLNKVTCTWSSGELGGDAVKEEVDTATSEMTATTFHDRGFGVGSTASGDKLRALREQRDHQGRDPYGSSLHLVVRGRHGQVEGAHWKGHLLGNL